MIESDVTVILVRYCEIGLKSTPVRRRFEMILKDNMLAMLAADGVEALITYAEARYYIETDDVEKCVASVKKVFGIASLSVAEETTSDLDDICRVAADYSIGRISSNQSFAVKARREGTHPYTSMDLGRIMGSAIFTRNEGLGIRVDLTDPDKVFYVEVRNNKAFIFDEYVTCPGGLPLGSQGRVIAKIDDRRGIVSAWMMMKRGCRVMVHDGIDIGLLRRYDPAIRTFIDEGIDENDIRDILGWVEGTSLNDLDKVDVSKHDVPVFFPTIGMNDEEVDALYSSIETSTF